MVNHEGALYSVKEARHVAKGNKRSYMQLKLKNFTTGQIIDHRANVDDMFETPFLSTKEYEYLYRDGNDLILADVETYDQIPVPVDMVGDDMKWLKENFRITANLVDGKMVSVELPNVVELAVTDTPPVVKGATATNQNKDAELETGAKVKVPPFIENGELLRIDTRTGEYIERAKS